MNTTRFHFLRASRRAFLEKVATASTLAGAGFLSPRASRASPRASRADAGDDDRGRPNPIPGAIAPLAPFGVLIHHNPLNHALALGSLNDPSQITDFNGFVGGVHILGGGTGTNTATGATVALAYKADMGFNQGEFIGTDGKRHEGTFAFV
jgi:hypothetical protein